MDMRNVDGEAVRAIPFEDLEAQFRPLIYKLAHRNGVSRWAKNGILGMTPDDFTQELLIVLWDCQRLYRPDAKSGFEGRKSSFFNYYVHAVENKFGKIRAASDKHYRPIVELECVACKMRIPVQGRAKCVCGGRRWTKIVGNDVLSVEGMYEQWSKAGYDPTGTVGIPEDVAELLSELPEDLVDAARQVVFGEDLSAKDRKALLKFGARSVLPPEFEYQKSIRR